MKIVGRRWVGQGRIRKFEGEQNGERIFAKTLHLSTRKTVLLCKCNIGLWLLFNFTLFYLVSEKINWMEEGKGLIKSQTRVTIVPPFPFRTIPLLAAAQIRRMHRNLSIPQATREVCEAEVGRL